MARRREAAATRHAGSCVVANASLRSASNSVFIGDAPFRGDTRCRGFCDFSDSVLRRPLRRRGSVDSGARRCGRQVRRGATISCNRWRAREVVLLTGAHRAAHGFGQPAPRTGRRNSATPASPAGGAPAAPSALVRSVLVLDPSEHPDRAVVLALPAGCASAVAQFVPLPGATPDSRRGPGSPVPCARTRPGVPWRGRGATGGRRGRRHSWTRSSACSEVPGDQVGRTQQARRRSPLRNGRTPAATGCDASAAHHPGHADTPITPFTTPRRAQEVARLDTSRSPGAADPAPGPSGACRLSRRGGSRGTPRPGAGGGNHGEGVGRAGGAGRSPTRAR